MDVMSESVATHPGTPADIDVPDSTGGSGARFETGAISVTGISATSPPAAGAAGAAGFAGARFTPKVGRDTPMEGRCSFSVFF